MSRTLHFLSGHECKPPRDRGFRNSPCKCPDTGTSFYKQIREVEFRQNTHNILSLHLIGNPTLSIPINKVICCYLKTDTINRIFIFYTYNIRRKGLTSSWTTSSEINVILRDEIVKQVNIIERQFAIVRVNSRHLGQSGWIALQRSLCLCSAIKWSPGNCIDRMLIFWMSFIR